VSVHRAFSMALLFTVLAQLSGGACARAHLDR
jgi:hypothetical protein